MLRLISATPRPCARKVHRAPHETGIVFGSGDIAFACALGYLDLLCVQIDWRARHRHLPPLYVRRSLRKSFQHTTAEVQTSSDQVA